MIYLDNAATGGFKPSAVYRAVDNVIRYLSANPGRSGHRLSVTGEKIVYDCRTILASTFNASPERVVFTKNCTEALNTAIFGTLKKGGHVITTVFEHNSVLRPLQFLQSKGYITLDVVSPNSDGDILTPIQQAVREDTYLIVMTSISNVTGLCLPIREVGNLCKAKNILFIVDGAQGGGHIPLDLKELNISALALASHKGLCGIMGSGVLIFSDNIEINPLTFGGTGTESFNPISPSSYPEKLEAGTLNLPAIAGLREGITVVSKNLVNFSAHLTKTTKKLIETFNSIPKVVCKSQPNPAGIVSFLIDGLDSGMVADILNAEYDIAVRGGFHCSPLTHKYLGTDKVGLVRVSIAVQNTWSELNHLIKAIKRIASKG